MEKKKAKLAEKNISDDDMRTIRGNFVPIPFDLIAEILKGLPVKTLARFLCISKQYASIILNKDFKKSYVIKSSTRPHSLIFKFEDKSHHKRLFFSPSQHQNRSYYMKCNSQFRATISPSVHGLICYGRYHELVVYNPSTRRSVTLPKNDSVGSYMFHYFGYDPINDEYKVLCMTKGESGLAQEFKVLTLGNKNFWRIVKDWPFPHFHERNDDICIKGVVYYEAYQDTDPSSLKFPRIVMSFDVRSERFDHIKLPEEVIFGKLISYEGKLAVMDFRPAKLSSDFRIDCFRIDLCVLEDAAKHEWSNKVFAIDLRLNEFFFKVFCITDAGEFVLGPEDLSASKPYYVLYYDHKKNSVRRVYIEGITELRNKGLIHRTISIFSGQVENLLFL